MTKNGNRDFRSNVNTRICPKHFGISWDERMLEFILPSGWKLVLPSLGHAHKTLAARDMQFDSFRKLRFPEQIPSGRIWPEPKRRFHIHMSIDKSRCVTAGFVPDLDWCPRVNRIQIEFYQQFRIRAGFSEQFSSARIWSEP